MVASIAHRGPDDDGVFLDGDLGLGHDRLSIIDLNSGQQPMSNVDGTTWIVFNGEIFNYVELRAELVARGHRFRTTSDTEVILNLYEERGADCVSSFNGQFAFALWDTRTRSLLLARDRLGVRPLFYTWHGGGIRFASEIKALLTDPTLPRRVDPIALDQIFTFWFPIAPRTGFEGIEELPPGTTLTITSESQTPRRYWSLRYPAAGEANGTGGRSSREYAEELMSLVSDAVRIRLRADVPVASYLSGGLDSSVISALCHKQLGGGFNTFSIEFRGDTVIEVNARLGEDDGFPDLFRAGLGAFPMETWFRAARNPAVHVCGIKSQAASIRSRTPATVARSSNPASSTVAPTSSEPSCHGTR